MARADQRKFHYIYKITRNDGSGKYYIGMHSTDDLEDGYFGSGKLLWKSIAKHGREKHSMEILEFLPSRKMLRERERALVNEEIVNDPLCMNLQLGGGGGFISKEHQAICSSAGGKSISSSPTFKIITSLGGKTTATKIKSGLITPSFTGRSHTASTIKKMKQKKIGHGMGEKNSQFGTCWVTAGVKPIKIKKQELEDYLSRGYRRGRT